MSSVGTVGLPCTMYGPSKRPVLVGKWMSSGGVREGPRLCCTSSADNRVPPLYHHHEFKLVFDPVSPGTIWNLLARDTSLAATPCRGCQSQFPEPDLFCWCSGRTGPSRYMTPSVRAMFDVLAFWKQIQSLSSSTLSSRPPRPTEPHPHRFPVSRPSRPVADTN